MSYPFITINKKNVDLNIKTLEDTYYSVTKIIAYKDGDIELGSGTGFFYNYAGATFLVTNKHVIKNSDFIRLHILESETFKKVNLGIKTPVKIKTDNFFKNPDKKIDIAVNCISDVLKKINEEYNLPFCRFVHKDLSKDLDKFIKVFDEIFFTGHPDGMIDEINYLPIAKAGTMATPYHVDFNGGKTFLINASVFGGSSGSPVFSYNRECQKIFFLGILKSTRFTEEPLRNLNENEENQIIHNALGVRQMIDVGFVIKAECVIETIEGFIQNFNKKSNTNFPFEK